MQEALALTQRALEEQGRPAEGEADVVAGLLRYIDEDVKNTGLKALQGMIWKSGFEGGAYRAHVYPDVHPTLERWVKLGLRLSIYSSGSVAAQRLFFGHTEAGDLTPLLYQHFDTVTGPKKESASYTAIATQLEREPSEVLFFVGCGRGVGCRRASRFADRSDPAAGNEGGGRPSHGGDPLGNGGSHRARLRVRSWPGARVRRTARFFFPTRNSISWVSFGVRAKGPRLPRRTGRPLTRILALSGASTQSTPFGGDEVEAPESSPAVKRATGLSL